MENNMLQEMSVELLKMESKWKNLAKNKPKEHPLPNVEAAKERVRKARKKRRGGYALIIVTVLFYLLVNPPLKAFGEAQKAQGLPAPTLLYLLFWFVMLGLALCALNLCLEKIESKDLNAAEIYEKNKKLNEDTARQYAADLAKLETDHKELVEKINREAGTKLGDASPRYFFQIPFDPNKTYQECKRGIEYYSEAFMETDLVEAFGLTFTGTAPIIHKPENKRHVRFDGFYSLKNCTVQEILPLLEKGGYSVLFQDEAYLKEHPEEEVWMQCIWDTHTIPVENQGIFKFKDMVLADCLQKATSKWSELEQFMGSGIPEYEPYVKVEASSVKDVRSKYYHKFVDPKMYDDVVELMEGDFPFRLVNAKKTTILEKGYLVFRDSDNRILYAALTDHPVYRRRLDFNCSLFEWKKHPRFHGWLEGVGIVGDPEVPDKASTIEYMCNELCEYMPDFDPSADRPDGLTDDQFRLWMADWRLATIWKKQKLEKQAQKNNSGKQ